jgi:flagellar hook-basal body complex protein FliE
MTAVSEARSSFNLMLEIRNKTLDAYQELMRMQV